MLNELRIAEMLCTRLCHDLTGPIGAVNNGAEFLSEEGFEMQGQAVELIIGSAAEAVSRLQFYRLAYGRVNEQGEANLEEKRKRIEEFFSGSKLSLDWPDNHADAAGISVSNKMARLMLNMVIIAQGTLLKGGKISIRMKEDASAKHITVSASGDMVKVDPSVVATLLHPVDVESINPKTVQLYLTRRLTQELSAQITTTTTENRFEITISQPY